MSTERIYSRHYHGPADDEAYQRWLDARVRRLKHRYAWALVLGLGLPVLFALVAH